MGRAGARSVAESRRTYRSVGRPGSVGRGRFSRRHCRDRVRGVRIRRTGSRGHLPAQRCTADQVLGQGRGVPRLEAGVPDAIGVDDGVGSIEAWPETTTRRDEYIGGVAREQLVLHGCHQVVTAARPAGWFPGRSAVRADKQMTARHAFTMFARPRRVNPSS